MSAAFGDVDVSTAESGVATVTIHRPPDNYFDIDLIASIADAYERLDADPSVRAIVLRSEGKHFCAGARLAPRGTGDQRASPAAAPLRRGVAGVRVPTCRSSPRSRARRSAAGSGLALSADFRVGAPQSRMSANFAKLGFHHGFALDRHAARRSSASNAPTRCSSPACGSTATSAHRIGLLDRLVALEDVDARGARVRRRDRGVRAARGAQHPRDDARRASSTRCARQRRASVPSRIGWRCTADFAEGIAATRERRPPVFGGS